MVLQSTRADNNNSAGSASTEGLARSISSKPEVRTPWRYRTVRGPVQGVLSLMHHITAIEKKYTSNLTTGECSLSKFCVCVYACVCVCVRVCGLPYRGLPYRGLPYRGLLYGLPYPGLPCRGCYLCVCMCERAVSKCVCMCVFCESCPKQEPR